MRQTKKQTGSLMIEMVAVIGLIALITPILFQQIRRRNEDIINTQIATEMRAVKDALSAYIQANELNIADFDKETDNDLYNNKTEQYRNFDAESCEFYEEGDYPNALALYFAGSSAVLLDYNYAICAYTVPAKEAGNNSIYRPVIYGLAYQKNANANLRQAAKIASLIGLEGGVGRDNNLIQGMQGAWSLDFDEGGPTIPINSVAVITSFEEATNSSILKDIKWQHLKTETAQATTIAAQNAGFKGILTVDSDDCIKYGTNSVSVKSSANCTPLFEVNAGTGEVRIAGPIVGELHITDQIVGEKITNESISCSETGETCEQDPGCAWTGSECVARYQLDPSYTSVMHDIKLMSLGGAKLSELLPKWSLVGVEKITDTGEVDWTCPKDYNKGITVIPTKFKSVAADEETNFSIAIDPISDAFYITLSPPIKEATVHKFCVRKQDEPIVKTRPDSTSTD